MVCSALLVWTFTAVMIQCKSCWYRCVRLRVAEISVAKAAKRIEADRLGDIGMNIFACNMAICMLDDVAHDSGTWFVRHACMTSLHASCITQLCIDLDQRSSC